MASNGTPCREAGHRHLVSPAVSAVRVALDVPDDDGQVGFRDDGLDESPLERWRVAAGERGEAYLLGGTLAAPRSRRIDAAHPAFAELASQARTSTPEPQSEPEKR